VVCDEGFIIGKVFGSHAENGPTEVRPRKNAERWSRTTMKWAVKVCELMHICLVISNCLKTKHYNLSDVEASGIVDATSHYFRLKSLHLPRPQRVSGGFSRRTNV
jgi:hypothetical protein